MAHESDEELSALIDGELPADAEARVRGHAASCPECAARLDRLGAASIQFKRSGERPVPAGLAERVKAAVRPRRPAARLVAGLAIAALLLLAGGVLLKKAMPALYSNIQQMITGAASQMGQGGN
jgi:anti-sigma factor RsiW